MDGELQGILEGFSEESLEKLLSYIKEQPLEVDKHITQILTYLCQLDVSEYTEQYESLLNELLVIFSKLHRVQNFIAKLIQTFKGTKRRGTCTIEQILPNSVLVSFEKCIVPMASWQVINILKTFSFHLAHAVTEDVLNIEDGNTILYIEFLSDLLCSLLSCVRMAEHSISEMVLEKFFKNLEEIQGILGKFGKYLVNIEHNPRLMRSFLKIADTWAEVHIILSYYSIDEKISLKRKIGTDYAACNLTYLHAYLTQSEWALISQRIANFGEKECKCLMEKLVSQKIKAMTMFGDLSNEAVEASLKSVELTEKTFADLQRNPYLFRKYISKLSLPNLSYLADLSIDHLLEHPDRMLICEDPFWIAILTHSCMSKINKAIKRQKRKLDVEKTTHFVSESLLGSIPLETLVSSENIDENFNILSEKIFEVMVGEYEPIELHIKSEVEKYINIMTKIPILYLEKNVQTVVLFYLFALLVDLSRNITCKPKVKQSLEILIIGILQHRQINLILLKLETMHEFTIKYFDDYKSVYNHIIDIVSKYEDAKHFKQDVKLIVNNIDQDAYIQSAVILLNSFSKTKKAKTIADSEKSVFKSYKQKICSALSRHLINPKPENLEAYAIVVKHIINSDNQEDTTKMLEFLETYVDMALLDVVGPRLFATLLQNRNKIAYVNDAFLLKLWNHYSKGEIIDIKDENFGKLIVLIFESISNEEFKTLTHKLKKKLDKSKNSQDTELLHKQIGIMTLALQASLGPVKNKVWVKIIEHLMQSLMFVYSSTQLNGEVVDKEATRMFNSIGNFLEKMVKHLHDSSPFIIDMTLINCCLLMTKSTLQFSDAFMHCVAILDNLLRDKKSMIMNRLPSYLQQYRLLFTELCNKSDTKLNLHVTDIATFALCSHKLERLSRNLILCTKDMSRIAPYLICDILNVFQKINIYPEVKMHLKTCLYSLISLCDKHAIKFVFRSTTCVEILKDAMENAKKIQYKGKI